MNEKETAVEKRRHKRYKAPLSSYIALMNEVTEVGQIINISKSGIAFSYIDKGLQITGWHKMNIFLGGNRFFIREIPFKAISNLYLDTEYIFSSVIMKQCGGQFGELTPNQRSQLCYFIANYTTS